NSVATAARSSVEVAVNENIDASAAIPFLVNGANNVLAVQLLNVGVNDTDALFLGELGEDKITGTAYHYLNAPTPGAINGTDYYAFVEKPVMSVGHGFFSATFPVTLTSTVGAQIRYTTDGSAPTVSTGTIYSGPINITGTTVLRAIATAVGAAPSGVATQTYLFLDQVIVQPALPTGFPTQWGPVAGFYQMNTSPAITGTGAYSAAVMKNALKAIPSVSIVTSMPNLFDPGTGIYANTGGEGVAWERPASLEWIDPTGGGHEFQIDCGLRVQGGASRGAGNLKHAFRVLFKSQYGPTKLKFAMFAGSPVDEFDTFDFHARFNDLFNNNGSAQYIRDMWCSDTQLAMGRLGAHHTFVHLYVNGAYWGLYDPGEKSDASFAANYLGGDKSEYDAVNSSEFIDGDATAWNAMFSIAGGGLSSDAAYANIKQYLDVPAFADYMLTHIYAGTGDWPWHNWNAARRRVVGAGYEFFCWDAEYSMYDPNANVTGVSDGNTPGGLWMALRQNAEFRQLVGDLAQKHCFNGGVLTPAAAQARWMARATEIDQAIIGETARWGNATRNGNWIPEQTRLLTSYFPTRTNTVIQQLRSISCFPTNNAPTFSQFGGIVATGYALAMSNPNAAGAILYTKDGTDPRLPGGGIAPGAGEGWGELVGDCGGVVLHHPKCVQLDHLGNSLQPAGQWGDQW
ncbi:MAG: chitobiase/beta-hexosaminidase C-terminal domain-containing protein, partial [Verrucomicrobia bacterium]|nr:chitobiase/beta-hexosaminidase C-terminal domain-containing protein [Verrucomicrobiota bacterium]